MAIPDYQTLMLPLLKVAADGKVHTKREALNLLAEQFGLTDEERKELLPSGNQEVFDNRIGWARTYPKRPCSSSTRSADTFKSPTGVNPCWRRTRLSSMFRSCASFPSSLSSTARKHCRPRTTGVA